MSTVFIPFHKLEALQKDLGEAREEMEQTPSDENVAAHNRAKALFVRKKLDATRRSWHEKTASLNLDKDMQGLWKLTKSLNEDNPGRSKTVIQTDQQVTAVKKSSQYFC